MNQTEPDENTRQVKLVLLVATPSSTEDGAVLQFSLLWNKHRQFALCACRVFLMFSTSTLQCALKYNTI